MIVYRLSKKEYINDISGRGAEISGGRWNEKGFPALYTASSRALAALEVAVHVPFGILPIEYYMVEVELPDNSDILRIKIADLPARWNRNPIVGVTQVLGTDFLKANKYLIMQVPSASVSGDYNYVINPGHADFKSVKVVLTEPFEFDSRLFKK
jgi:RES domain-containing protein